MGLGTGWRGRESLQPKALAARAWGLKQDRAVEKSWFGASKQIWVSQCPSSLKKQLLHAMSRIGKSIETEHRLVVVRG